MLERSFRSFLKAEFHYGPTSNGEKKEQKKRERERRRVYNFFLVPRAVEWMLYYGFIICVDAFLNLFTFMPLRVMLLVIRQLFPCCQQRSDMMGELDGEIDPDVRKPNPPPLTATQTSLCTTSTANQSKSIPSQSCTAISAGDTVPSLLPCVVSSTTEDIPSHRMKETVNLNTLLVSQQDSQGDSDQPPSPPLPASASMPNLSSLNRQRALKSSTNSPRLSSSLEESWQPDDPDQDEFDKWSASANSESAVEVESDAGSDRCSNMPQSRRPSGDFTSNVPRSRRPSGDFTAAHLADLSGMSSKPTVDTAATSGQPTEGPFVSETTQNNSHSTPPPPPHSSTPLGTSTGLRHVFRNASEIHDFLRCVLLVACISMLSLVDVSAMYHTIRGQHFIKLYFIFNCLEVMEKLLRAFGQDVSATLTDTLDGWPDPSVSIWDVTVDFIVLFTYVLVHSLALLVQIITFTIAVNSQGNALWTLLITNNFVELKTSVFKRFDETALFQLTCSDAVERFQFGLILSIICREYFNVNDANLLDAETGLIVWENAVKTFFALAELIVPVLLAELVTDWVKHPFITKYNNFKPEVYLQFHTTLCKHVVQTHSSASTFVLDRSFVASQEMQFMPLPLACATVRMFMPSLVALDAFSLAMLFLVCVVLKVLTSIMVLGHAAHHLARSAAEAEEKVLKAAKASRLTVTRRYSS